MTLPLMKGELEGVFCELGVARFKTEVSLNATQLQ